MNHIPALATTLFTVITLVGCVPNGPVVPVSEDITGQWMVQKAKRNNRNTNILAGTFFVFNADGTMASNLPIMEEIAGAWDAQFKLEEDTLKQTGTAINMKYAVKAWSDSTLTLEFTTRGVPFHLELGKVDSIPQPPEIN